jgi:hypothetical protein
MSAERRPTGRTVAGRTPPGQALAGTPAGQGPASQTARLHFLRFEFKYVMARAVCDEVEAELRHFVELDPYVAAQPDHRYLVRSLYFDDPDFSCYREKCDGVHTRRKFRIRTYGREPDGNAPWFLETKGRYNNLVFKHRTPFTGGFDRMAAGDALIRATLQHAAGSQVRDEFEFQCYRRLLCPVAIVDYLRRPYISRFDPDFRLTFDSELTAAQSAALFPRHATLRALLPGYTVMEIKFRHHVPSWFHRILQAYELRRRSISKICTAMEALGLQIDPS